MRTKTATVELADKLNARGYASAAINGDLQQSAREQTIDRLKNGKLDILIATDVAARGLDVPRISHVINYDITQDVESYVHRIGRTGRAGREGVAILFVTPREKRMLYLIEKTTGKKIEQVGLPSTKNINDQRVENFKLKITEKIDSGDLQPYLDILESYQYENNQTGIQIAAALASLAHDNTPLLLQDLPAAREERRPRKERTDRNDRGEKSFGRDRARPRKGRDNESRSGKDFPKNAEKLGDYPDVEMERFAMTVGFSDGIKPGNIVGAIANEVDIESKYILNEEGNLTEYWVYKAEGPLTYHLAELKSDPNFLKSIGGSELNISLLENESQIMNGKDTLTVETIFRKQKIILMKQEGKHKKNNRRILFEYK